MSQQSPKVKVALKYCGSCNPHVDLSRIAHHLAQVADKRQDFKLVPFSEDDIAIVVILCGCPRACGDKEEVRARSRYCLVIAGESLERKSVPEKCLPTTVERELVKILGHMKQNPSDC